jgi:8-oxo-dGTP pyrophosphatase MutT (NUDIX family)
MMLCANCGKSGHVYKTCSSPITSYGVICYRIAAAGERQVLMVQRKDSLAYVEFIRGKYALENVSFLKKLFSHMTSAEHARIASQTFESLWYDLWQITALTHFKNEYDTSNKKFMHLKHGYEIVDKCLDRTQTVTLAALIDDTQPLYETTEWGFPKGRRNIGESDFDCAVREFFEETGVPIDSGFSVDPNVAPFQEIFIGTNNVVYKHVYYLMHCSASQEIAFQPNRREIEKVAWFTLADATNKIRDYNTERKLLIERVESTLLVEGT